MQKMTAELHDIKAPKQMSKKVQVDADQEQEQLRLSKQLVL